LKVLGILFVLFYLIPVGISAVLYLLHGRDSDWRSSDRSSAGLLAPARDQKAAVVRIFSARTIRWRGIFATHSWIVIKDRNASAYQRFDYTAWGEPIWINRFVPDGRWFGSTPEVVFAADGDEAERMIPKIRMTIQEYRFSKAGDYHVWPGPNSNTFVAAVMRSVPGMTAASLPATAVGKDFPYDGSRIGWTPSRSGVQFNADGYFGVTLGWVEGFEVNLLGAVAGVDFRRPALKLPGLGRVGIAASSHAVRSGSAEGN
jgi:hypothetical protein